jgi:hypothetical protein
VVVASSRCCNDLEDFFGDVSIVEKFILEKEGYIT